jgi:uncharacterized protein
MFPKLDRLPHVLAQAERLMARVDQLLPGDGLTSVAWDQVAAARWQRRVTPFGEFGGLIPIAEPQLIAFADLLDIDEQRARLDQNTQQFVAGLPANHALLTGSRGTGKSSLVKATLQRYVENGLRLIEMERSDLTDLPQVVAQVGNLPYKFIVFSDDLSFEASDPAYKSLKSVLDGSVAGRADNILIYATSNRRHLMPEFMSENLAYTHTADGEIHPGETSEEKVSLSERFGLWLSFYPFDQDQYLRIARHWVHELNPDAARSPELDASAKLWALERASRNGRVAYQFARHFAGAFGLTTRSATSKSKTRAKPADADGGRKARVRKK